MTVNHNVKGSSPLSTLLQDFLFHIYNYMIFLFMGFVVSRSECFCKRILTHASRMLNIFYF